MKASKIVITIPMLVLLSGCTYPALNIKDPSPVEVVKLNVDKIEVVNNANIESLRIGLSTGFPPRTFPLGKEVQSQFHEAINRNAIKSLMAAGLSSNRKAIIGIDKAVVTLTYNPLKSSFPPFGGILFLGMDDEYTANIEGAIEIEDAQKGVIDKADFRVNVTIKGLSNTGKQITEGQSNVTNEALNSLQKEIVEKTKCYLYKYLL